MTMDKITITFEHGGPIIPDFANMKLAVLVAVLRRTEYVKVVVVALPTPSLSLSITIDKKKIRRRMLFLYLNVMKRRFTFEK